MYTIYSDEDLLKAAKEGHVPSELYHRMIRGTIHCMMATAMLPPFQRCPSTLELEEMAKSLILQYPCIKDKETNHVRSKFVILNSVMLDEGNVQLYSYLTISFQLLL